MFSQEVMEMLIKGIGETLYMTLGEIEILHRRLLLLL